MSVEKNFCKQHKEKHELSKDILLNTYHKIVILSLNMDSS